jgi:hypothetical protein
VYKYNLLLSLINTVGYACTGRLHFPRNRVGTEFDVDGKKWIIFREAVIRPRKGQPEKPGAIFMPRFHVAGMSLRQNIVFSLLPMCFILGLPGFRSKLWMYNSESGDSAGYYEWDTIEDAENYRNSQAVTFMTRRSAPGSVSFKVTSNP